MIKTDIMLDGNNESKFKNKNAQDARQEREEHASPGRSYPLLARVAAKRIVKQILPLKMNSISMSAS